MQDAQDGPAEPKILDILESEVTEIKGLISMVVRSVIDRKPEHALTIYQAEWHIRGLVYHFERMLALYRIVADQVGTRALAMDEVDFIIMHSPDMQDLIFEFYALINMARITLDESIKYIRPLFAAGTHLPKSINDFLKGRSDCPLSSKLSDESALNYLVDIRNCVVHYRTFATSDNSLVVADGADEESLLKDIPNGFDIIRSVTRVYFRRVGGTKVAVNVLLPDAIFEESDARKRLAQPFSYSLRINLLSQSREFVRLGTATVAIALDLLATNEGAAYFWLKQ